MNAPHIWNKDERRGRSNQAKGKVKQAVGTLTGNPALKADGQTDEDAGTAEVAIGRVRHAVGDALAKAAKAVKR